MRHGGGLNQSNLVGDLAKLLDHCCGHFVHGLHAAELVGVGEEIALERWRAGREVSDEGGIGLRYFQEVFGGSKSGGFDGASDVEHGEAFGHDYSVEINVATPEAFLDVDGIRRLVEEVFSCLERTSVADVVPENERLLAANDPGGLEFAGDAAGGVARMQHHEGLSRRFNRDQKSPGEPASAGENSNQNEPEDLAHDGDSLDDAAGWGVADFSKILLVHLPNPPRGVRGGNKALPLTI